MNTTTTTTTSIDKDFTFAKKHEKGRLHASKVCKAAKEYKGGCEHCSSDIHKGTFVLTADEVVTNFNGFGVRTVKTHRLCASCTADYIKATSGSPSPVTIITPVQDQTAPVQDDASICLQEQREWVKRHGIEVGTKVYILRPFVSHEGGSNIGWKDKPMAETVGKIGTVDRVSDSNSGGIRVVMGQNSFWYPHFVLSKATEYELAQAKWVQENGVKEGMKVRYTRGFKEDDSGASCNAHMDAEGMVGHIEEIKRRYIKVTIDDTTLYFLSPYTALELVITPTYRPFTSDELNDLVGKVLLHNHFQDKVLVTERATSHLVKVRGVLYTADELLSLFTLDGEPCGMKEKV